MAKRKNDTMDTLPEWDSGTYQTGSTTPPKVASGRFTVLLLMVIFLGGLVSGLGLINIRLLKQLSGQPNPTIHVSMGDHTPPTEEHPMFTHADDVVPAIPYRRKLELNMIQSPYYSNNTAQQALENGNAVYLANQYSLVEVYTLSQNNVTQSAVGVILSSDGFILTNAHLLEAAKRIVVSLPDGRLLTAALVGSDNMTDMAVLYVQADDLVAATFGTSTTLQVTDPIYTISLQENARSTMVMFEGNMFTASRKFATDHYSLNLLQTCHHSESGPLFNSFGHIVGLCVSRTAQYFHEMDNLGVVLGSSAMGTIIDQLVQQGYVSGRPDLGFQVESVSKLFQHYWDLPGGLMVSGVTEDSQPYQQGLRNGDIILALDSHPLTTRDDLYTVLYSCSIGQEVIAVIFRDGNKKTVTLTVEELGA